MGHTFYFLTATWLAAQGADPKDIWTRDVSPCGCQNSYSDNYVHSVGSWDAQASSCGCSQDQGYTTYSGQEYHGILGRIQSRLGGLANVWPFHRHEEGEFYPADGTIMQSGSPAMAMPSRSGEPPLADAGNSSTPRSPVAPADFHAAPPVGHGLLIEPEPN